MEAEPNEDKGANDSAQKADKSAPQRPIVQVKVSGKEGKTETSQRETYEQVIINLPKDRKTAEWIAIVMTGLLGLIALCIYNGQLVAMRESNALLKISTDAATKAAQAAQETVRQARDNMRLEQRAWVTAGEARLEKPLVPGKTATFSIQIVNSGKTPALDVHITGSAYIAREPMPEVPPNAIKESSLIGPEGQIFAKPETKYAVIDEREIKSIRNAELHLFAKGRITYVDIFEVTHTTTFCFALEGKYLDDFVMRNCETPTAD